MKTTPYADDADDLMWRARSIARDMDARIAIDRILIRAAHEASAEVQDFREAVDRIAEAAPSYPIRGRNYLHLDAGYRMAEAFAAEREIEDRIAEIVFASAAGSRAVFAGAADRRAVALDRLLRQTEPGA